VKSIRFLETSKKTLTLQLIDLQSSKAAKEIAIKKNDLQIVVKSLYTNYYNLNVADTKLNQQINNIDNMKKDRNARRKASWKHVGIAKMRLLDYRLQRDLEFADLREKKNKYYKKIQAFKKKYPDVHSLQGKLKKQYDS